jgi:hypothetical protein
VKIRRERAVHGGPTYPDFDHVHVDWDRTDDPTSEDWRVWLEDEARHHGGRVVVHLGLDSMSDYVVVEP